MTRERGRWFAAALALALAFVPAMVEAQGVGRVTGRVVDQANNAPIAQAQIVVVGTTLGARTNDQGEYTLVSVPAGQAQLRVLRLGYASVTRPVTVVADQSTTADFALQEQAIALDVVVVNAVTGQEQRTREVGANVSDISVEDIPQASLTKFADVLAGRTAGVSLQGVAGTAGTSQRIRIRGANSLSLSNEPLIFLDGVQVSNSSRLGDADAFGVGGQDVSRLNDINPDDIQKVEVLKGPAASALYGTAAANGVILITTKRGQAGRTTWNVYAEGSRITDETDYPSNYLPLQIDVPGEPLVVAYGGGVDFFNFDAYTPCFNFDAADGLCAVDTVLTMNSLRDSRLTPFSTGHQQKYGLNVSGGGERATYYLSGEIEDEQGVISYNDLTQANLRANLQAQVSEDFNLTLTSGYVKNQLALNSNDNSIFSPLINGLIGPAFFYPNNTGTPGVTNEFNYGFGFGIDQLANLTTDQDTDRFTLGLNGNYRPLSWLVANANLGLDLSSGNTSETLQPGLLPIAASYVAGFRQSERASNYLYTGNTSLQGSFVLTPSITSTTTLGGSYQRSLLESTRCYGVGIISGTATCGGTAREFDVDEDFSEIITVGGFLEQRFGWNDRLFLAASIRGDDNSAFGENFGFIYYPAASLSWVVIEEPWFPEVAALSNLRLRTAYGTSGLRPNFRDAITLFQPIPVTIGSGDVPGISLFSTGNEDLEPERTTEWEAGFDLGFLDNRVVFDFTYFTKRSRDALIERRLPPSLGLTETIFDNLGSIRNSGIEAQLQIAALQTEDYGVNFTLNASTLSNEVEELGEGVEDIIFNRGNQRHTEGKPAGAFFQPHVTYADANGDGLLSFDEVEIGDPVYIGPSLPTRTFSLITDITLFEWIRVSTLFDYRGGNFQLNDTEQFRCQNGTFGYGERGCAATGDPSASLRSQAAFLASVSDNASNFLYIEDADFVKWRELAVTFSVPQSMTARWAALQGASLTLAGRNLKTWTDYTGLDPEINETGGDANFTQGEFNTQPPVRYLTARLNFTF